MAFIRFDKYAMSMHYFLRCFVEMSVIKRAYR